MTSPQILVPSLTLASACCPDVAPTKTRVVALQPRWRRMMRSVGAVLRFELTVSDQLLQRSGVGSSPRR